MREVKSHSLAVRVPSRRSEQTPAQHWKVFNTRHTDTQELWVQNAIRNHELEKVSGEDNVLDILTKKVKSEVLEKHMAELGFIRGP